MTDIEFEKSDLAKVSTLSSLRNKFSKQKFLKKRGKEALALKQAENQEILLEEKKYIISYYDCYEYQIFDENSLLLNV